MEERCKEHHKILFGNGRMGLLDRVLKVEQTVEHMNEHLESLSNSFQELAKCQIEAAAVERSRARTLKLIGAVVGLAIPLTALIVTLL